MTDQEIDRWVEEHIKVPPKEKLDKYTRVVYPKLIPAVIEWGKVVAHKFYKLGKSEILINLTWQDIQMIVAIADHLLEVLKPGEHAQKYPTDESYYSAVLDEYNRLHQTKA